MDTELEQLDQENPADESVVDDFDLAFGDATSDPVATDKPTAEATNADDAPAVTEPTADKPAVTEPTADKPAATEPAADKPAATEPAATEPAATAPKAEAPQVDAEAIGSAVAAALAADRQQQQQQPAASVEPQVETYTPEHFITDADKAVISKFKTEWPDEYAAIERMQHAAVNAACYNTYNAAMGAVNKVLAPVLARLQASEVNAQQSLVHTAHADYDTVLPQVREWVAKQPSFMRGAMETVLEKGSAQERIELVSAYKEATVSTGAAPATPASSAAQETQPTPAAAPAAPSKAAIAALAAVPAARRSKPAASADPADFDSAFNDAIGS